MRAVTARWTPVQRGVIDATKASLGLGKPDRPQLPRDPEGFLEQLRLAATSADARGTFLERLAGPAKVGLASVSGRLAVFDAATFAAIEHMDQVAIPNAQRQARHDPDGNELIEHRQGLKRDLGEAAKAVRAIIAQGR